MPGSSDAISSCAARIGEGGHLFYFYFYQAMTDRRGPAGAGTVPAGGGVTAGGEGAVKGQITSVEGIPALSLDAISSVAY